MWTVHILLPGKNCSHFPIVNCAHFTAGSELFTSYRWLWTIDILMWCVNCSYLTDSCELFTSYWWLWTAHILLAGELFTFYLYHYNILRQVGMDGTGKSTVVQLASHIAGCELFKLTLHRGYGTSEFRDDLKKVFTQSGVKGQKIVFLLTDSDIVKVIIWFFIFSWILLKSYLSVISFYIFSFSKGVLQNYSLDLYGWFGWLWFNAISMSHSAIFQLYSDSLRTVVQYSN